MLTPHLPVSRHRGRAPAAAALLAVALTVAGVGVPAYATAEYTVEIESSPGGLVTGAGTFAPGETVSLTAVPDAGQVWGGWTSAELDWIGARTASFTMPEGDVVLETAFRPQAAPLKDVYSDYFDVGNIWSGPGSFAEGSSSSQTLQRHFDVLTAENHMKPDQLLPNSGIDPTTGAFTFNFGSADAFVAAAEQRGSKVHGHVLVWHGQSPARINSGATGGTRQLAQENMRRYIQEVLTRYSGRIPTWDVVNEAFVDGLGQFDPATQDWRDFLRGGPNGGASNWYAAYANGADVAAGESPADFIYDAFRFARQYGPEVQLQYNDFNVFQSAGKGSAIVAMAQDLNARYAAEHPGDTRPLIEAIGMQSHNYINQTPAFACSGTTALGTLVDDSAPSWQPGACSDEASVEASIRNIVAAGLEVAISELDLMVWEAWNGQPEGSSTANYRDLTDPAAKDRITKDGFTFWADKISNRAELEEIQAQRFAEYFSVYKAYASSISRVTFWGLTDRVSWRATHNPLLLNSDWSEKLALWAVSDPEGWYARDAVGGEGIPVEATVTEQGQGSLALTVADFGDGVTLSAAGNAGDRLRYEGELPAVTVTDSRSTTQAGGGGWSVTGRSSEFSAESGGVGAEHLGWTPTAEAPRPGVVAGAQVPTVLSGGPGLAATQALASATSEGRFGSAVLGAALLLELPVDTDPGTYAATLTVSLFPVD